MDYQVILTENSAKIDGRPDVYLHFAKHDFRTVWNPETGRHDIVKNLPTFFGGMGEGREYDTWQNAILASLYDCYQVEDFKTFDTFTVEFEGETAIFECIGFHVIAREGVI
jgi:hypothetical protein